LDFWGEFLDDFFGMRHKVQLLDRLYWPGGSTVLGGGLRSLVASSYDYHSVSKTDVNLNGAFVYAF